MKKLCPKCNFEREFSLKKHYRKSGPIFLPLAHCKECESKRVLGYLLVLRKIVNEAKDKPCTDCGHKYPPYVMDFDHTSDDKEFTIGAVPCVSPEVLRAEIAKCDVVCANCHRERTHRRSVAAMSVEVM